MRHSPVLEPILRGIRRGKPERQSLKLFGKPSKQNAIMSELHNPHHPNSTLERHPLQPTLISKCINVRGRQPQITPHQLNGSDYMKRDQQVLCFSWHKYGSLRDRLSALWVKRHVLRLTSSRMVLRAIPRRRDVSCSSVSSTPSQEDAAPMGLKAITTAFSRRLASWASAQNA